MMTGRALTLFLLLALLPPLAAQETIVRQSLDEVHAAALAADARPWDHDELLWQVGIRDHGKIEPVLERLRADMADTDGARARRARILLGLLLERDGFPEKALPLLLEVPEAERDLDLALEIAGLLDLLARGDEARGAYQALLDRVEDPDLRATILLRLALLDPKSNYEGLLEYARGQGLSAERRNEAAVILALGDRQAEAVELFTVTGEKGDRYRELVRLAEWALGAQRNKAAQSFAWDAVAAAITKRDRRYALSLVAGAYRAADQVDELLARFEEEAKLSEEARRVWIELLREEGRAAEALRLVQAGEDESFSPAMKRQLLEICREAGNAEILVATYLRLIEKEPTNLEWRSGLARHFLENGQAEEARSAWSDLLDGDRDPDFLITAAHELADVGLGDLAIRFARRAAEDVAQRDTALLFIAQLEHQRGRYESMTAVLNEITAAAAADAGIRAEVADAYERIGRIDLAVATLEGLRAAYGGFLGTDLDMKYALALSKVGREEDALVVWRELWGRLRGTPRGRYVEDRLMTVASRIGKLAQIAIELEDRLAQGSADTKDIDLLVRLYIKVNDPASATEIVEEYLKGIGSTDLEILKRKAQIYAACLDFYHYEQVCRQLIELDEENRLDHMRELVMSQLDRGRRDEAIAMLPRIRAEGGEGGDIADEFEAGVYGLAGMKEEALEAYMRGMGRAPDRIDTLLLIANLLQESGREMQAARRFQQLAMRADKDDLFTIAIDGILNLRAPRESRVPNSVVSWARRVCLERLARDPGRFYLHRLVADLSEELNDVPFAIRCLKAAVPIAGERRTPLLREIMSKSRSLDPAARQVFGLDSGMRVSPTWDPADFLMVGRRLLGQGEYVPPQVFMDMAAVFLAKDRVDDAMRTFSRASELLDRGEVTLQAAQVLEKARCYAESLTFYRRLLATDAENVVLVEKVGELQELCADEAGARAMYERGLDLALSQLASRVTPQQDAKDEDGDPWSVGIGRNVDALDATFPKLVSGLVATLPDRAGARALVERLAAEVAEELAALGPESDGAGKTIAEHPRLGQLAEALRRLALGYRMLDVADPVDARLMAAFPEDAQGLRGIILARTSRGLGASAATLLRGAGREGDADLAALAGIASLEGRRLTPAAVAQEIVPRMEEPEVLGRLLERVDCALASEAEAKVLPHLMAAAIVLDRRDPAENFARAAIRLVSGRGYQALDQGMRMLGVARRISPGLAQELLESLVDRVLEKEPQLAASLSYRIDQVPGVTISAELARRVASKMVEVAVKGRPVYGLANWLARIPTEERPAFVRELNDKLESDQRLPFLLDAVTQLEEPLDQAFVDWFAAAVQAAFAADKSGSPQRLNLSSGTAAGGSVPLRLAIIDLMEKRGGVEGIEIQRLLTLADAGRDDEAFAVLKANLSVLLRARTAGNISSFYARRVVDKLAQGERGKEVYALVAEAAEAAPEDQELAGARLEVAAVVGGDLYRELLEKELERKPDDVGLLTRLRQLHLREGRAIAALEVLKTIAEKQPDDDNWKRQLMAAYAARRMPLEAEAIRLELEGKELLAKNEEASGMVRISTLAAAGGVVVARTRLGGDDRDQVGAIRKLLEAGKKDEARAALRRLWRGLGETSRYQPPVSSRLGWDDPKPKKEGEKSPRTVLGALAEEADFIGDEARRVLRFLEGESEEPEDFVIAELIDLALPKEEAARRDLLEALAADAAAGRGGALETARIFVLLEEPWVDDARRTAIIDTLIARRSIPESRQVRGLARGLAVGGRREQAARLYLLTALLGNASSEGGYLNDTEGWRDFLLEANRVLGDELGPPTVLAMLENLRPSDWRLGSWLTLAIEIWERVLPVGQALERGLELLAQEDREENSWEMQQVRPPLARIALAAGNQEAARQILEPAIGKRDGRGFKNRGRPLAIELNEAQVRGVLTRMWSRYDRDQRKSIKLDVDLAGLFECLRAMHEAGRLEHPASAFATLAFRICELEDADEVLMRRVAEVLRGFESDDDQFLRARAAVERRLGETETAYGLELLLRARGRLGVDRLAEHLREFEAHEGPVKALEIGRDLALWCNHPDLLAELLRLAEAAGEAELATRYRELKEAVLAQEAADKARLEAEKLESEGETDSEDP